MPITEDMNVFEVEVAKIFRFEDKTKLEAIEEATRRFPELYQAYLLRIQEHGQGAFFWELNRHIDEAGRQRK
jgi:hypothetical protein